MSFWVGRDNDSPHNHQRPALVLAGAITAATQSCLLPRDKVMGGKMEERMVGGRNREGERGRVGQKRELQESN